MLRHFRFSLSELFLVTLAAAVGLARWRQLKGSWYDGLLCAVCVFFVIGLVAQCLDIRRALRAAGDISKELRFGARLAIGWRLAVVAIVVGYFGMEIMRAAGVGVGTEFGGTFGKFVPDPTFLWLYGPIRSMVLSLVLLIVVLSAPQMRKNRRHTKSSIHGVIFHWLTIGGLILYGLIVWREEMLLPALVYISTVGIELFHIPSQWSAITGETGPIDVRQGSFLRHLLLGVFFAGLGAFGIIQFIRRWHGAERYFYFSLAVLGTAGAAGVVAWIYIRGLRMFSAPLAEAASTRLPAEDAAAILLLALGTGALVWRLIQLADQDKPQQPSISWRRDASHYYHERPICLTVLAVAVLFVSGWITLPWSEWVGRVGLVETISYQFILPNTLLATALLCASVSAAVRGWRNATAVTNNTIGSVSPNRFLFGWVCLFLIGGSGAVLLGWLLMLTHVITTPGIEKTFRLLP